MLQEILNINKDPYMLKVKQCKKIYHGDITQKKSEVAILISK